MRLVLPGALPDPNEARELLPYLSKTAPLLQEWFERARSQRIVADPAIHYCTSQEYWLLQQCGFIPESGQVNSAGLGPMLAKSSGIDTVPVWLAELVHVSPSRDGAVLIPAKDLTITPSQSLALFQSAQDLFEDTDFKLQACTTTQWRITLPDHYSPSCASPNLVSISTVNDWWRQDIQGRAWRRLVNELQMLWFDHPVNQERNLQGQAPINSIWLFGGATTAQLSTPLEVALSSTRIDDRLSESFLTKNWQAWLTALASLEAEYFTQPPAALSELVLLGPDVIVTLIPDRRFWSRWKPGAKNLWKKWWYPLNS